MGEKVVFFGEKVRVCRGEERAIRGDERVCRRSAGGVFRQMGDGAQRLRGGCARGSVFGGKEDEELEEQEGGHEQTEAPEGDLPGEGGVVLAKGADGPTVGEEEVADGEEDAGGEGGEGDDVQTAGDVAEELEEGGHGRWGGWR